MRHFLSAAALVATLASAGVASAQSPPTGGPDAKGNAPIKHAHTVNDGTAKPARNSFTQGQARKHIEKSGYSAVSPLTKGADGVWRGTATKNGGPVEVGLDFKGNVVEGGPGAGAMSSTTTTTTSMATTDTAATSGAGMKPRAHHRRRHRAHARCAHPGPNGTACSGVDRNENGISDKEDRAIRHGAKP